MKTINIRVLNKRRMYQRKASGQAIAEGAATMVVMVPLVALLVLFLINAYAVSTNNVKIQSIASTAARTVVSDKWWLGMTRTDYSKAAEDNAREAIEGQLGILGLRCKRPAQFTYSDGFKLREKQTSIVRVDFDVESNLVRGGFFPSLLTMHASGVSSDAEHAVTRHGQIFFEVVDPTTQQGIGIRIPAYNATVGLSTPAHGNWLNAGRSAGKYPVAYLQVRASTEGSKLMRSKDVADANFDVTTEIIDRTDWRDRP